MAPAQALQHAHFFGERTCLALHSHDDGVVAIAKPRRFQRTCPDLAQKRETVFGFQVANGECLRTGRLWKNPQRELGEDAQRSKRAADKLWDVEPGDVFDDLSACLERFAQSIHGAKSEQLVTN